MSENTVLSTPPSRFTTPPTMPPNRPPRRPPDDGCCGGVLYCTITLIRLDEFASMACKSGEILELSANAWPESSRKIAIKAVRVVRLEYFGEFMMAIWKARQPPEHKPLRMNQLRHTRWRFGPIWLKPAGTGWPGHTLSASPSKDVFHRELHNPRVGCQLDLAEIRRIQRCGDSGGGHSGARAPGRKVV